MGSFFSETLCEGIVVYLQLGDLSERNRKKPNNNRLQLTIRNVFGGPCIIDRTDLGVLIDRDCGEGGFGECEGLEDAPSHAIKVVSLHHMEARLISMHGMQNELQRKVKMELEQESNPKAPQKNLVAIRTIFLHGLFGPVGCW